MVIALGPGKFYGSSLPRPRYYTDVKLNKERIDPPGPVLDPLLSWAREAHWSMGGVSFKRRRLQGKIEGSVQKLRAQLEGKQKNKLEAEEEQQKKGRDPHLDPSSFSPALTRKRLSDPLDDPEEEEEEEEAYVGPLPCKRARKLSDEFDKVAASPRSNGESGKRKRAGEIVENRGNESKRSLTPVVMDTVASRTRSRRLEREEDRKRRGRGKQTKAKKSLHY